MTPIAFTVKHELHRHESRTEFASAHLPLDGRRNADFLGHVRAGGIRRGIEQRRPAMEARRTGAECLDACGGALLVQRRDLGPSGGLLGTQRLISLTVPPCIGLTRSGSPSFGLGGAQSDELLGHRRVDS